METLSETFLVFFILSLLFTCFLIYTLIRLYQSSQFISHWKSARLVYIFQTIQLLIRSISFWVICILNEDTVESESVTFAIISLPDCLILASYIMIFWVMINCTRYTRIDSDYCLTHRTTLIRAGKIALIILFIWLTSEILFYTLLFFSVLSSNLINIQQASFNFLASIVVLVGIIAVQVKYSGLPPKTAQAGKYMKTVIFITGVWTIGRIAHGVIYFIMTGSLSGGKLASFSEAVSDPKTIILIIVDLIITELMCYYVVLDYSFFRIFLDNFIDELDGNNLIVKGGISMQKEIDLLYDHQDSLSVSKASVIMVEQKGKLGGIFIANHELSLAARRITLPRISKYVIENLENDIIDLKKLNIENLVYYEKFNIFNNDIELIMPYFHLGSLYDTIHKSKTQLSVKKKLKILHKTADIMKKIHAAGRTHGHLSSQNILLKYDYEPFIADLGLEHFKKYCGLVNFYCNKSAWSSPEVLKDQANVVIRAQSYDDIFSFGMVIWEVIYNLEPFAGYSLAKLRDTVVKEELRPRIEVLSLKGMEELMKSCWNKIPDHRPDFKLIEKELLVMINNI